MLKFALKNMAIKKTQVFLIILSIVISAGIAVLAFNVPKTVPLALVRAVALVEFVEDAIYFIFGNSRALIAYAEHGAII